MGLFGWLLVAALATIAARRARSAGRSQAQWAISTVFVTFAAGWPGELAANAFPESPKVRLFVGLAGLAATIMTVVAAGRPQSASEQAATVLRRAEWRLFLGIVGSLLISLGALLLYGELSSTETGICTALGVVALVCALTRRFAWFQWVSAFFAAFECSLMMSSIGASLYRAGDIPAGAGAGTALLATGAILSCFGATAQFRKNFDHPPDEAVAELHSSDSASEPYRSTPTVYTDAAPGHYRETPSCPVRLRCVGCGAGIEVEPEMPFFFCVHCGTKHTVEYRDGVVSVVQLTDRVPKPSDTQIVRLVRLQHDLEDLRAAEKKVAGVKIPPISPAGQDRVLVLHAVGITIIVIATGAFLAIEGLTAWPLHHPAVHALNWLGGLGFLSLGIFLVRSGRKLDRQRKDDYRAFVQAEEEKRAHRLGELRRQTREVEVQIAVARNVAAR